MQPLDKTLLPAGVSARFVDLATGLKAHLLEAGDPAHPQILLLHGFPELAYSWRKVMPDLASAGFHVVAPDQRGYGRTTGWDGRYDGDLASCRLLALVRDTMALVAALGKREVACLVGHDFGSPVAAWCALTRPDVFRSVVLMAAPFAGPPPVGASRGKEPAFVASLAALPRPRKHYQWYYSTREADEDMRNAPQGLSDFLRAYYHMKSADWPGNAPFPLAAATAEEFAKLPTYYVMDFDATMPESVAPHMPSPAEVARCRWLTDAELAVYVDAFRRTGFQCALNWYRCRTGPEHLADLETFAGRTVDVPSLFIGGAQDWGVQQIPNGLDIMRTKACTRLDRVHLIEGAGHWVQQERPEAVISALLDFMRGTAA